MINIVSIKLYQLYKSVVINYAIISARNTSENLQFPSLIDFAKNHEKSQFWSKMAFFGVQKPEKKHNTNFSVWAHQKLPRKGQKKALISKCQISDEWAR